MCVCVCVCVGVSSFSAGCLSQLLKHVDAQFSPQQWIPIPVKELAPASYCRGKLLFASLHCFHSLGGIFVFKMLKLCVQRDSRLEQPAA